MRWGASAVLAAVAGTLTRFNGSSVPTRTWRVTGEPHVAHAPAAMRLPSPPDSRLVRVGLRRRGIEMAREYITEFREETFAEVDTSFRVRPVIHPVWLPLRV